MTLKCRPTVKGLIRQVNKVQKVFPAHQVTLYYEATNIDSTLKRDLHAHNITCVVVTLR